MSRFEMYLAAVETCLGSSVSDGVSAGRDEHSVVSIEMTNIVGCIGRHVWELAPDGNIQSYRLSGVFNIYNLP